MTIKAIAKIAAGVSFEMLKVRDHAIFAGFVRPDLTMALRAALDPGWR